MRLQISSTEVQISQQTAKMSVEKCQNIKNGILYA